MKLPSWWINFWRLDRCIDRDNHCWHNTTVKQCDKYYKNCEHSSNRKVKTRGRIITFHCCRCETTMEEWRRDYDDWH